MGYELVGRMAEACTCKTFCPCTAGQEPDGGSCEFAWGYRFDQGQIDGVDVSGLNMVMIGHLDGVPGVPDMMRAAMLIDRNATEEQEQALLEVFGGKHGGPLADLAGLIGEVVAVERVPIHFDVSEGTGRFIASEVVDVQMEVLRGPDGSPTKMQDFALSGVLGRTAYHASPTGFSLSAAQHGFDFAPNSATQFEFSLAS